MKTKFSIGAFTVTPIQTQNIGNRKTVHVDVEYTPRFRYRVYIPSGTRQQMTEALAPEVAKLTKRLKTEFDCAGTVKLTTDDGSVLALFETKNGCVSGMSSGKVNSGHEYWLVGASGLMSVGVTLDQYATIRAQEELTPNSWVADLLPDDILTTDIDEWRAPTSWEIRHVVGAGSFTRTSGAKAAELVGISATNFRKYTASDSAKTQQKISFATWHMLLHRLGVQKM